MQSWAGLQLLSFFPSRIAVVSDETCGSGNYTVQMSLRPAAEASPELQGSAPPQDAFLASLAMRSSSSQPVLRVRSCCVTPSSSPGGPSAVCCLLPRYGMGLAWGHPSLLSQGCSPASLVLSKMKAVGMSPGVPCSPRCQHQGLRETWGSPPFTRYFMQ